LTDDIGGDLIAEPVWTDPLVAVLPVGHLLTSHDRPDLDEVLRHPLILCHPDKGSGSTRQIDVLLKETGVQPLIADHVTTLGMMLTLVGAGYGIGFALATHLATVDRSDIAVRPFAEELTLTTYLLRANREPCEPLARFIERAAAN
jgi:DNA-binding transcriptional LysR family regulator